MDKKARICERARQNLRRKDYLIEGLEDAAEFFIACTNDLQKKKQELEVLKRQIHEFTERRAKNNHVD